MLMDALECTLHTVRLHWVEFQNKFYKGEGYKFKPYSYVVLLENVLEEWSYPINKTYILKLSIKYVETIVQFYHFYYLRRYFQVYVPIFI